MTTRFFGRTARVKLWDAASKSELQTETLVGGKNGNWLIIEKDGHVYRGEDGTWLRQFK